MSEHEETIERMAHEAMEDAATIFRLKQLLRRLVTSEKGMRPWCPICQRYLFEDRGHTDDCKLAKELADD